MNHERTIVVDIGGNGGRAQREAHMDWNFQFYIIDPSAKLTDSLPYNVRVLPQAVDNSNPIPFDNETVYKAYIDFLLGEVINPHGSNRDDEDAISLYRNIVWELRRVIAPNGLVCVMDVRANIYHAQRVFEVCGFDTTQPRIVQNRNATNHARTFFDFFLESGLHADHSAAIPMEFTAYPAKSPINE